MNLVDKINIRQHFDKVSDNYDSSAVLQREIAKRLSERLDYIKLQPTQVLDLGSGTGFVCKDLLERYSKANVVALDIALNMAHKSKKVGGWLRKPHVICGDAELLPFKPSSFDLIVSNLMLPWINDLSSTFTGFHGSLAPNGLLLFSTFGPDTLKEMRQYLSNENGNELDSFVDMHDIGDALLKSGFINPVTDMEIITMTYNNVSQIIKDVENIGLDSNDLGSSPILKNVENTYQQFKTSDGLYPATWEIIYGHAWVGEGVKLDNHETVIPIHPVS